jgi:hypothetical protein
MLLPLGLRLPMYPGFFTWVNRRFGAIRSRVLGTRWGMNLALVIGTIARKE